VSRVLVIINPVSGPARRGSASERVELAVRTLERLGARPEVRLTERPAHAEQLARDAAGSGVELVIAWGGDGTINEVARALVRPDGRGPALGIIPGGSGNGLARELRIPFDPVRAIERALRAQVRHLDVGQMADRLFFNVAGIGLDARVAAGVAVRVSHRGFLPYLTSAARDLLRYRSVEYTVTADGQTFQLPALIIALANATQYGFGVRIAPTASLEDGRLDLVIVQDRGIAGNLWRVPALLLGRLDRCKGVTASHVQTVTIRSREAMVFHVDGEVVQGSDTLVARVHPGALSLRA
jgi:YegS/Rv2252/BmrU family lipid kinase